MKIFVNRIIRRNPWGGGIHFVTGFIDYAESIGHKITNKYDNDVDIILMIDPRPDDGFGEINHLIQYKDHLKRIGKKVKVVHRINDSDIARGTNFLEDLVIKSNYSIADATVFVSNWLKEHYEKKGFDRQSKVIRNATNLDWFRPKEKVKNETGKIKLVTHHWSDNYNKGFDAYIKIDEILKTRDDVEFTYIGRYYKGYVPTNTKLISPLYGQELGDELRKHDIYVTASRFEACGMHYIEAAASGLPILYHKDGGAVREMCNSYGIQFDNIEEINDKITELYDKREQLSSKIAREELDNKKMFDTYLKLFEDIYGQAQ